MTRRNIVINALPLISRVTGIGKYTYEVSKRILQSNNDLDVTFYYGYFSKDLYAPQAPASGKLVKNLMSIFGQNFVFKNLARATKLYLLKFLSKEYDVYWEPAIVPLRHMKTRNLVTTVHDFSFHLHPEWLDKEQREYITGHFWKNIPRSARIITGSYYTKDEIVKFLRYDPAKIDVIYHGVDHTIFKPHEEAVRSAFSVSRNLPKKYLLFVGSIEPRKNLLKTVLAYNQLPHDFKKEFKFVLAGFSGWNNTEVMAAIEREKENITYLGYLSDLELAYLYNGASLLVYPSLYEGFGLPPLEAMACGTPVVVSRVASLPEVCGDTAFYIDPHTIESIVEGMYTVATDDAMRKSMAQKGLARAKEFTWEESARKHMAVFNALLNR